jgi:sec-independent protein translocase protein TatB
MFDIGWSELLVIAIVALVAIGPKELPGALRTLGQWTAKLRRMASEFQSQFHEAMREAEMADLKKQVDELTSQAHSYTNFDPIADVRKDLESTQHQIESAFTGDPAAPAVSTPASASAETPAAVVPSDGPSDATSAIPLAPAPDPAVQDAGGKPA